MTKARKRYVKPKGTKKQRAKIAKTMNKLAVDFRANNSRPLTYHPDFARQAILLVKKGATDTDLAEFFGVTTVTIWAWQTAHQDFSNAIRQAKKNYDERIEQSLASRAAGMTYDAEKIFLNKKGEVVRVAYKEYLPPSDTAAKFWLTNRRPLDWKDRRMNEFDPDQPLNIVIEGGLPK